MKVEKLNDLQKIEYIKTLETTRELELYDATGPGWVYREKERQEAIQDAPEEVRPLLSQGKYQEAVDELLEEEVEDMF